MRFLGGIFADDGKRDLAGPDVLQSFAARDQFAIRREDGGDSHDVACCNTRVAKRELEAGEPFAMFSDAFGKKDFLSDERHGAGVRCLRENVTSKNFVLWKSNKKVLQCQRLSEDSSRISPEKRAAYAKKGNFTTERAHNQSKMVRCRSFPRGVQSERTFPRSSEVKSGPASCGFAPLRLTCLTPTTR